MVQVGDIVKGKVSGITSFGAFVTLESGESGLIHISEISDDYIEKVEDGLTKGQEVTALVTQIVDDKLNLSIKKLNPKKEKRDLIKNSGPGTPIGQWEGRKQLSEDASFEDKITKFMKESNEKNNQIRARDNKRQGIRKKRS